MLFNLYVPADACNSSTMADCCSKMSQVQTDDIPACCQQTCHKTADDNLIPQPNLKMPNWQLVSTIPTKNILDERVFNAKLTQRDSILSAADAAQKHWRPDKLYLLTRCLLI